MLYELVYITPLLTTEESAPLKERVLNLIKEGGGEVVSSEMRVAQKLAYPIKKYYQGNLVFLQFNTEPDQIKKISEALTLNPDIIRHQFMKVEKPTFRERAGRIRKPRAKPIELKMELEKPKEAPPAPPAEEKPKKPVSAEEIDKKLEEILKDTENI